MTELSTIIPVSGINNDLESHYFGFDREAGWAGGKNQGVLQYCSSAASGEVYNIASDKDGAYTKLTGQTTFADGTTALADRTVAIMPDSGEANFSYWFAGHLIEVTGIKTYQVTAATGSYVCFNSLGNLEVENDARTVIMHRSLLAFIYDNSDPNIWFGDERHGSNFNSHVHLNLHQTVGLRWARVGGGAEVYGLADNGTTFTKISEAKFADEDIRMVIAEASTAPFVYKETDGNWDWLTADNNLFYAPVTDPQYNDISGGGGLADLTGNDCMIMVILACNNKVYPYIKIIGQEAFADRTTAREALYAYVTQLSTVGLPGPETRPICSYIISSQDNALEKGADDEIWIDHREGNVIPRYDTLT